MVDLVANVLFIGWRFFGPKDSNTSSKNTALSDACVYDKDELSPAKGHYSVYRFFNVVLIAIVRTGFGAYRPVTKHSLCH